MVIFRISIHSYDVLLPNMIFFWKEKIWHLRSWVLEPRQIKKRTKTDFKRFRASINTILAPGLGFRFHHKVNIFRAGWLFPANSSLPLRRKRRRNNSVAICRRQLHLVDLSWSLVINNWSVKITGWLVMTCVDPLAQAGIFVGFCRQWRWWRWGGGEKFGRWRRWRFFSFNWRQRR